MAVIAVIVGVLLSYYQDPLTQTIFEAAFNNDLETLLHVAVKSSYSPEESQMYIESLTQDSVPRRAVDHICQSKDKYGNTVLHWASKSAALDVAHYLIRLTCFQSPAKNNAGSTALHWAATAPGPRETFIKPYRPASDGENAPHADGTVLNFDMEKAAGVDDSPRPINLVIPLLLSHGWDVNGANKAGETPLHWAIEWQSLWSVRALLYANATVSALDQHQNTPLHKISSDCQENEVCTHIVSLMVAAAAPTMVANEYGRTVLEHFDTTAAVPTLTTGELYYITEAQKRGNILSSLTSENSPKDPNNDENTAKSAKNGVESPNDSVLLPPTRISPPKRAQAPANIVKTDADEQGTESGSGNAQVSDSEKEIPVLSREDDEINE